MISKYVAAAVVSFAGLVVLATCAGSENQAPGGETNPGGGSTTDCEPGEVQDCDCSTLGCGTQECLEDGSGWDECDCGQGNICGDCICEGDGDENCHTCIEDCGPCDPCDIAPSCSNAMIPPADPTYVPELDVPKMDLLTPDQIHWRLAEQLVDGTDAMRVIAAALESEAQRGEHELVTKLREAFAKHPDATRIVRDQLAAAGMGTPAAYRKNHPVQARDDGQPRDGWQPKPMDGEFPGGTMECGAPMLRVGIHKIHVHNPQDTFIFGSDDEIYCLIQAEAQNGAELRLTPLMTSLEEGDEHVLSLESGVFWGQLEPTTPGSDIIVTYDCIESDDASQYTNLLDAISDGATNIGENGAPSGWIFTTVGAVAGVVSAAMSGNGDDQIFNAQQHIPLDQQLALTCGGRWSVRRGGSDTFGSWDWELTIWAWGCAEFGVADPGDCAEPPATGGAGGAGGAGGSGGA